MTNPIPANSKAYLLMLVGALASLGPFVTDFYLPAFPELTVFFNTHVSMTQMSLTFCMLGLSVGQIFIGPLSDKYGRKIPLYISIVLFTLSSFACIFSWNILSFIFFRFIQGLSGAGGIVISKSIVVDNYQGKEMAGFFSMLSVVQAIAPILAPVLGGFLLSVTNWKGIFMTLVVIELLLLIVLVFFKESLSPERRKKGNLSKTFKGYGLVVRNKKFMYFSLVQAFSMGVMFAYIASSPFLFQKTYGLSPFMYSLCFGLNATAVMVGNVMATKFQSVEKALLAGSKTITLIGVCIAVILALNLPFIIVEMAFFVFLFALGILLPSSATLALDLERNNSGKASAIFGFMSFFMGGIASPLTGVGNMLYSTGVIIFICCCCISLCTYKALNRK